MINDQTRSELSNDFFKQEFRAIHNVMIDFECFKDIRLGALLSQITTEVQYQYIISKLALYSECLDRTIMNHFPALSELISEEMIDQYIQNELNHRRLVITSPVTNLYNELPNFIKTVNTRNTKSLIPVPFWTLYICCGELDPNTVQKHMLQQVKLISEGVKIEVVKGYPQGCNKDLLKTIDHFIINDIIKFLDQNTATGELLFTNYTFLQKTILARKQVDPMIELDPTETINTILERTAKYLDVFCTFQFVNRSILIKE